MLTTPDAPELVTYGLWALLLGVSAASGWWAGRQTYARLVRPLLRRKGWL